MADTDPRFAESGYAHPEVLVSTDWVAEHLNDPNVRIVESDEDVHKGGQLRGVDSAGEALVPA